jgi:hypothetical protein
VFHWIQKLLASVKTTLFYLFTEEELLIERRRADACAIADVLVVLPHQDLIHGFSGLRTTKVIMMEEKRQEFRNVARGKALEVLSAINLSTAVVNRRGPFDCFYGRDLDAFVQLCRKERDVVVFSSVRIKLWTFSTFTLSFLSLEILTRVLTFQSQQQLLQIQYDDPLCTLFPCFTFFFHTCRCHQDCRYCNEQVRDHGNTHSLFAYILFPHMPPPRQSLPQRTTTRQRQYALSLRLHYSAHVPPPRQSLPQRTTTRHGNTHSLLAYIVLHTCRHQGSRYHNEQQRDHGNTHSLLAYIMLHTYRHKTVVTTTNNATTTRQSCSCFALSKNATFLASQIQAIAIVNSLHFLYVLYKPLASIDLAS